MTPGPKDPPLSGPAAGRPQTHGQRLFAAACVRLKLSPGSAPLSGLYEGIITDLQVDPDEVEAYLRTHRAEVEAALRRGRSS